MAAGSLKGLRQFQSAAQASAISNLWGKQAGITISPLSAMAGSLKLPCQFQADGLSA
jgi:hypothetical protein